LQTAWQDAVQSANGKVLPSSFGKPKAFLSQSRSFAKRGKNIIAEFKVQDDVLDLQKTKKTEESLKANEVFPLEPAGF